MKKMNAAIIAMVVAALILGILVGYVMGAQHATEMFSDVMEAALSSSSIDMDIALNETAFVDEICKRTAECDG